MSIREIARRAGVSTGTVTRHYPTKESLFRAVALHRIEHLVRSAEDIAARESPATAFFTFFAFLVRQSAADHAVGDALTGAVRSAERSAHRSCRRRSALVEYTLASTSDGRPTAEMSQRPCGGTGASGA